MEHRSNTVRRSRNLTNEKATDGANTNLTGPPAVSSASPRFKCSWILLLVGMLFGTLDPLCAEELSARYQDGTVLRGRLEGGSGEALMFLSGGQSRSLKGIESIDGPPGSPVLKNDRPARIFHLRGGGRISGEWIRLAEEEVTLKFRGNQFTLPKKTLLTIDSLPGEWPVFYDGFDSQELSPAWTKTGDIRTGRLQNRSVVQIASDGSLAFDLETPRDGVRWSAAFYDPAPADLSAGLELDFGEHRLTIAASETSYAVRHSQGLRLTTQRVRRTPGWRRLTVLSDGTRFQVLLDSRLLASGRPLNIPLQSFRLFVEEKENAQPVWFDDVLVSELRPSADEPPALSFEDQDQVLLRSGDVLFGEVQAIGANSVRLKGSFGKATLPWHRVRRIVFAETDPSPAFKKPSPLGWSAEVRFQRYADHPSQPGDRLSAMLLSADEDSLTMFHPWLGTIAVPWEEIDRIEPRFLGRSLILSPDVRHLGDQTQASFRSKRPIGSAWRGAFSLDDVPGRAFLRIEAAELEPAGPETPPGSRYLSELRRGFLGTEVFLNGQSLGRLNDRISKKSPASSPESLRLEVPQNVLKPGKNTWRIEQRPLSKEGNEFDDCELGPVVLEMEVPE